MIMKKAILSFFCFIFAVGIIAQDIEAEKEIIKKTIKSAYVEGIHNIGDLEKIDAGFHPGFNLLIVNKDNTLYKFPIYTWKEKVDQRIHDGKLPREAEKTISCKFPMIDITGNAAIAKVELYEKEEIIFTDYLALYKIDATWKIVSKTYHAHK